MRLSVLAFLGGVLVVQFSPALPSLSWTWLLLPAGLAAIRWRHLLPLIFFILGLAWTVWRAGLVLGETLPPALEGRDVIVEGHIADLPREGERGKRFDFDVEHAALEGHLSVPRRILLTVYEPGFEARVGDRWRLVVRLKQPHGFQNPGGFDYEAHLIQERIRATGYVRKKPEPVRLDPDGHSYPVGRARQHIGDAIRAALPEHPFLPMLVAFVNGDEQGITNDQWRVLQHTGTAHLIAISGMNIGFVAGLAFLLGARLWAWPGRTVLVWPAQKVGALVAILAAASYAALAGFAIPTQRALIMVGVAMLGVMVSRRISVSHLLAAALFVVLACDPLAAISAGFWLSFVSVAVILFYLHGAPSSGWRQWGRVQWSVSLGLLPLTILLFQQVPIAGPLANLLAIPVIELAIIPLTLAGSSLLALGLNSLAGMLLRLAAIALGWLWVPLEWLAQPDVLQWTQHRPEPWSLAFAVLGMLWLLAPRGWPARWLGAVWLVPMFIVRPNPPQAGEVWVTVLDVGQGLAAVVRTRQHTLLFDTGPRFSERFDAGSAVVVPYLRSQGIDRLDMLVVSHGDNDHAGGAAALLENLQVDSLLTSVPDRFSGADACREGQRWSWDGVQFAMLNQTSGLIKENNAACVLLVVSAFGRALLPGDIEKEAEEALVARFGTDLAADAIVAPHHGSKTSSSALFVDAVKPRYVLYSVGYRNPYRHPHSDVAARYAKAGATAYDSATNGAIEIHFGRDGQVVSLYREKSRRYWFASHLAGETGL